MDWRDGPAPLLGRKITGHWATVTSHGRCFSSFRLPALGAFGATLYTVLAAIPAALRVRAFVRALTDTGGICQTMEGAEEWRDARCTVNIGSRRILKWVIADLPD